MFVVDTFAFVAPGSYIDLAVRWLFSPNPPLYMYAEKEKTSEDSHEDFILTKRERF